MREDNGEEVTSKESQIDMVVWESIVWDGMGE